MRNLLWVSTMQYQTVYVGLGGNIGDTKEIMTQAVGLIAFSPHIRNLELSHIYKTTPVSTIPQDDYLNAVCRFQTDLSPFELQEFLQKLEKSLGKKEDTPKNAPRIIDLDILFFGNKWIKTDSLTLPHPRWKERLFVLKPLSDLADELQIPVATGHIEKFKISQLLKEFTNPHRETVVKI